MLELSFQMKYSKQVQLCELLNLFIYLCIYIHMYINVFINPFFFLPFLIPAYHCVTIACCAFTLTLDL